MKKLQLLMAILVVTSLTSLTAQEITYGGKAGLNLSSFSGDETDDLSSRASFHLGILAELEISEKFSFQPEVLYSSVGTKYDLGGSVDGFTFQNEGTIKLDYLTVPLLAKYYVTEGLSIEAGPQIGFLLSANQEFESTQPTGEDGSGGTTSGDQDVKDLYSGFDLALGVGAGYKLDNGLHFSLRYNLGLSNILDIDDVDTSDFSRQNSVFQFSIGYFFL